MGFKRYFSLCIFTLLTVLTSAGISTIKITTNGNYVGKTAYLYTITDAFSNHLVLKDSATIGVNSMITLQINNDEIQQVQVCIDRVISNFYIQPTSTYEIIFPVLPPTVAKTFNKTNTVNVTFNNLKSDDINFLLSDFNYRFDEFFDKNISNVFDKGFKAVVAKFRQDCDSIYSNYDSEFLKQFIHFSFGNFELNIGVSRKIIFERYLSGKEYLAQNEEFGKFVAKYFGDQANRYDLFSKDQPLNNSLNKGNLTDFLTTIKRDDFLQGRPQLTDLAAFTILAKDYDKNPTRRKQVLGLIQNLGNTSTRPETKTISQHLITQLTQFQPGYPVYAFSTVSVTGKEVSLNNLKGKPTCLIFAANWSKESISELRLLNDWYTRYADKINFVLFSIDSTQADLDILLKSTNNKIETICSIKSDHFIIEALNILYIPQFVLIDDQGNYIKWFTPEPTRGLDQRLNEFLK